MKPARPPFRQSVRAGFSAFRRALVPILLFELVYRAATALLVRPLLSLLMQTLLWAGGSELAFNDQIWRFALSVPGILAIVLLAAIATLLVYFEFAAVITLVRQSAAGGAVSIREALVQAIWSLGNLKSPSALLFALYGLVLLPLVNMGVTSSLLPQLAVPNFILGEITKTRVGEWALLAAAAAVVVFFFCLLFTLPAMVLEHIRFGPAVKKSFGVIRAYGFKILGVFLVFVAVWAVLFLFPRQIFDFFYGAPSVTFFQALTSQGLSLRTPVMVVLWVLATVAQAAVTPLLLSVLTTCYLPVGASAEAEPETLAKIGAWLDRWTGKAQAALLAIGRFLRRQFDKIRQRPFVQKHKRLITVVLVLLLGAAILGALNTGYGIHDPIVVGHRGSAYGVENSLEAIQAAIDAGADYTEVDILLSSDGVPMVIHDANLKRLAGQNLNVWELTAAELQALTLSQNGYTAPIPTLEEVVALCEGKILLAVEYKLHGHETADLVQAVMAVMEKSEYQKKCLFLSLDYGLVQQMKTQYPAWRTGYCVYGNVGWLDGGLKSLDIDFLLVEEWMVSADLIKAARKAWIPVYVWTVNDSEKMDDYLRLGVSGLVTDYPDAALAVLSDFYNLSERNIFPEDDWTFPIEDEYEDDSFEDDAWDDTGDE